MQSQRTGGRVILGRADPDLGHAHAAQCLDAEDFGRRRRPEPVSRLRVAFGRLVVAVEPDRRPDLHAIRRLSAFSRNTQPHTAGLRQADEDHPARQVRLARLGQPLEAQSGHRDTRRRARRAETVGRKFQHDAPRARTQDPHCVSLCLGERLFACATLNRFADGRQARHGFRRALGLR